MKRVVVVSWFGPVLENVRTSIYELSLKRKWVMQQDNNPKHTSCFSKEQLKKNKVNVLEWLRQSLDLSPIEMLWKHLKQAVHRRKPTNNTVDELKWLTFLQDVVQDWSAVTRIVTCSYCCKRGSHQILKAKIHILLSHISNTGSFF